jgi:hypothetical protein
MKPEISPELAAALVAAQGVQTAQGNAAESAAWVAGVLERSAPAFAQIAFEDEPAGFSAAQRRAAP